MVSDPCPSTLGTFLPSFIHGHTLQLDNADRHVLDALAGMLPSFPEQGLVLVDLDDTILQACGYQKQAAAHGYDTQCLTAMVTAISTKNSGPLITTAGLRRAISAAARTHAGTPRTL